MALSSEQIALLLIAVAASPAGDLVGGGDVGIRAFAAGEWIAVCLAMRSDARRSRSIDSSGALSSRALLRCWGDDYQVAFSIKVAAVGRRIGDVK